ncbi:MAG: hypothetical protein M9890_14915 [Thermomicrobiales bacterium]|nr:hypothetical protein [Thermomicrobiales bacterium]
MVIAATPMHWQGGAPLLDFDGALERASKRYRARLQAACAELAGRQEMHRPVRPAHVRLVGELADSGFRDRQWLVERDGQFIQLTELLYRVVEHADGERSLDDLATIVAEQTGRPVSGGNIATLIERTLGPAGLLVEGTTTEQSAQLLPRQDPLAVRMRLRMLGPRVIDPVARLLRWLYWPPLMVAMLVMVGLGHLWLYADHGVRQDWLMQVLVEPHKVMLLFGIIAVGGMIHELGHAAALRYGGGQVRSIGVGWYLFYPVFYTDVTDSYRLGRWAKVRTDLGGFYFHLLFTFGLIIGYQFSGIDLLLIGAVAINIEVVRQSLPFLRLDGYWTLTDLTGVPDLVSQIGPFVRSLVPASILPGPRLPRLRRWVAVVFATYIVVTIPLMATMLIAFLRTMPATVEMMKQAGQQQAHILLLALRADLPLVALTSLFHLGMLGLIGFGMTMMLANVARLVLRMVRAGIVSGAGWVARRVLNSMSPIEGYAH